MAAALAEVEAGQIAYLTRAGRPVAALVPVTELAELQHTSEAAAIAQAQLLRDQPGPRIPHDVVEAMIVADDATHDAMAAALDAHAEQNMSPDEVRALWETISAGRGVWPTPSGHVRDRRSPSDRAQLPGRAAPASPAAVRCTLG